MTVKKQGIFIDKDKALNGSVAKGMIMCDFDSKDDIAEILGISRQTFTNRLKDPGKMTVADLRYICRLLKIPDEEKAKII